MQARLAGTGELAEAPAVMDVLRERLPELKRLVEQTVALLPPSEERPEFIRDALKHSRWL